MEEVNETPAAPQRGQNYLWIDQYGEPIWARTVKELREKAGGGCVSKQYVDKKDGTTVHNGYIVGSRWFTKYMPVEVSV